MYVYWGCCMICRSITARCLCQNCYSSEIHLFCPTDIQVWSTWIQFHVVCYRLCAPHFISFFVAPLWFCTASNIDQKAGVQLTTSHVFCYCQRLVCWPTLTAGFGPIPFWSLGVAHDACQSGVALQQIAALTVKCHHGSQLVVGAHTGAIHHVPGIKTCLP